MQKQVGRLAHLIRGAADTGRKILIADNGGSAAEAKHLLDELLRRYRAKRRPHPAIALTADSMVLIRSRFSAHS